MLKKEIEEVLDYIDGDFTADAHNSVEAVKIYPLRDVELVFNYIVDTDQKDFIRFFLMYLSFTPYNDFWKSTIDIIIKKYPNDGYEADLAVYYIDRNSEKTLEICEMIKEKYNSNDEMLDKIRHIERMINWR